MKLANTGTAVLDQDLAKENPNAVGLADAICSAIERLTAEPLKITTPDRPLPLYRDMTARHRAGAVGVLLGAARAPHLRKIGANLQKLAGDSPLANVAFAEAEPAAHQAAAEVTHARTQMIADLREHPKGAKPARILLDATHLLQLGDIDGAKAKQAALSGADPKFRRILQMRILDAEGFIADADRLALQIQRMHPDTLPPYAGIAAEYRRVGSVELPAPDAAALTPAAVNAYLRYLILNDKRDAAIAFAAEQHTLVGGSLALLARAASVVLAVEGHGSGVWRRIITAAETLPVTSKVAFMSITAELTPHRVASLLDEAVIVAEDANCTQWTPLIERGYALAEPPPTGAPTLNAALSALLTIKDARAITPRPHLHQAAAEHGIIVADESTNTAIFRARTTANAAADLVPAGERQTLTPRAAQFLQETRKAGSGLVLLSAHGVRLGRGNYLSAAAAALAGFSVKTVVAFDGIEFEQRFQSYIDTLTSQGGRIEIVNRKGGDVAEETLAMLAHLGEGGAIDIAPDGIYTIGQKTAAPWLMQPMPISIYAAQLAVAKGAAAAFTSVTPEPNGRIIVDMIPLALPPATGALPVRAAWLTQRLARTIRQATLASETPVSMSGLVEGGGRPAHRTLLPLAQWGEDPVVRQSLCGWLASMPTTPEEIAFQGPNGATPFGALRDYALSSAAMLLHFQAGKPAHLHPNRRFLHQHRVLTILPDGEAALALSLGALAAGSLISVNGDDTAPAALADRVRAFKPDLIIAGASIWSSVLGANARLNRFNVLITDDAGDAAAIRDLTYSFPPATELPLMAEGMPGVAVFTSGSDGAPKGVVVPNTVLSGGTGLDKLLPLSAGDRVAYFTRWDAIGIVDILACLRGGAAIIKPAKGLANSAEALLNWITDEGVSVVSLPASLWAGISRNAAMRTSPLAQLRAGIMWGERIETQTVRQMAEVALNCAMFTTFGASEATYMSFGQLDPAALDGPFSPGGKPAPSMKLTITSGVTSAQGAGAEEDPATTPDTTLNVTGPNVMLGYFADLADANALLTPHSDRSIVLTDQIRLSAAGDVEIYGRRDAIIKISGRRVSLMEAQTVAETVPGVRRAVAFVLKDGARDRIALALESDSQDPSALKLLAAKAIADSIFPGARPQRIAVLSEFPAGPSGKLDRAKLRAAATMAVNADAPPIAVPAPPIASAPQTPRTFLSALEEWATYNAMAPAGRFNPDARPPELDSIDIMDLMLLAEETSGKTGSTAVFGGDGPSSWRALAAALAPGG